MFADTLVRFSPRRVELPPGVPQTVRVQVRLPAGLPAGEYRSHMTFRAVPTNAPEEASSQEAVAGVQMKLRAVYGVSVPVIVRRGLTAAELSLSNPHIEPGRGADPSAKLAVVLRRTGNRSIYGDLTAVLVREGRPDVVVGRAKGLAVYSPNAQRNFLLPVQLPPVLDARAQLRVRFVSASGATDVPLAETSLALR
jgi:hypothetical protein